MSVQSSAGSRSVDWNSWSFWAPGAVGGPGALGPVPGTCGRSALT